MRGLIIKDLLFLKSSWKNYLVIFIGSLLISIALGNYTLAVCILPLMILSSGINTFQTDEFYNTESYTLSYPLSRNKIVLSKYIFTIILLIISIFIGLIIYYLILYIGNPSIKALSHDVIKELLMLQAAALLVDSFFYPVIYKFGCEKSRLVLMSIVMGILGIGSIISVYMDFSKTSINIDAIVNYIQTNGLFILSWAVIICITLSYLLSILFYKKKDY
jgi:ABC-type transport system involved in multi-copper enzyme maturation permease subunit